MNMEFFYALSQISAMSFSFSSFFDIRSGLISITHTIFRTKGRVELCNMTVLLFCDNLSI